MLETVLFYAFGFLTIITAVGVVWARNPLHSALSLIGSFFGLAALYAMLGAHLLAAIQILVYAGAVMVLFIFVIMLLNLKDEELGEPKLTRMKLLSATGLSASGLLLIWQVFRNLHSSADLEKVPEFGTVASVGKVIYGAYLLPFEATSLLLLVAIVAAVVIAKAKI